MSAKVRTPESAAVRASALDAAVEARRRRLVRRGGPHPPLVREHAPRVRRRRLRRARARREPTASKKPPPPPPPPRGSEGSDPFGAERRLRVGDVAKVSFAENGSLGAFAAAAAAAAGSSSSFASFFSDPPAAASRSFFLLGSLSRTPPNFERLRASNPLANAPEGTPRNDPGAPIPNPPLLGSNPAG